MDGLLKWKNKKGRQPLILRGARQVGKTWLLQEFGRTAFADVLYVNCENAPGLKEVFDGDINSARLIDMLGALHGKRIEPQETLLIFDEIQEIPRALTALKYFAEQAPDYCICCAGSLLGVALHSGTSFPVGKIDFLTLGPLCFEEFLLAIGEGALAVFVRRGGLSAIPKPIADKLTDYLKIYFVVGGMPAAVNVWVSNHDFLRVGEKQRDILATYENDFSKHAPKSLVPRLRYIWSSIPTQLAKENKKFIYGLVREGARAREYEGALLWLIDAGILRKVGNVTKAGMPLKAYEDAKAFKLYHLDIGLLRMMSELDPGVILQGTQVFEEYKGALTEQYVLGELIASDAVYGVYYWTSERTAEVDFLFSYKADIFPLEVKGGGNVHAKSLQVYRERYQPRLALRASMQNLRQDGGLLNIPLYALFNLEKYLSCEQPDEK
jgi:predicted AAA+ superfamily ATPase